MQVAEYLPKFLKKHKIINFLILSKLQRKLIKLKFNGNSYNFISLADPEPRNVFIQEVFELDFFKIAENFMPENGTFFDIGANVGFCTFGLISSRPKASFHLFEANIKLINLLNLSKGLHANNKISINHCCIGNTAGTSFFKVREDQSGQSHVSKTVENLQVPNCMLDIYCEEQKISTVDFAKIDIEGYELPALKGWSEKLSNHSIRTIHIEIIPENQARYGFATNAPLLFLESLGYELFFYKSDDFKIFDGIPKFNFGRSNEIPLLKFAASKYPCSHATDVLALPPHQ